MGLTCCRVWPFKCRVGVALAALLGGIAGAQAGVVIVVNKSTQRLSVSVDGTPRYEWPVSTARQGYNTPNGTYGVERMAVSWFSRRYDWSPMPHSIFFDGGYAIHGTYEMAAWARRPRMAASACIRTTPPRCYNLVQQNRGATRIVVTGGGGPSAFYTRACGRRAPSAAPRGAAPITTRICPSAALDPRYPCAQPVARFRR